MVKSSRLYIYRLITMFLPDSWHTVNFRVRLLRWCGAEIGKDVWISSLARFEGGGRLIIEDGAWIGRYAFIASHGGEGNPNPTIRIEKNVRIAHMCSIKTSTHEIDLDSPSIAGKTAAHDIVIGEGSWLCANVTIIPGVTVGRKCVCAAGAVVIRDVPDYSLVAGVPAVVKRNLNFKRETR